MSVETRGAISVPVAPVVSRWIRPDKISSSTCNLQLGSRIPIAEGAIVRPQIGDVVVVRVISDSATYNQLELTSGRLARINPHDIVVGVLGRRRALKGFVGDVPSSLEPGDRLHVLNLGGVLGWCRGRHHRLGRPIEVEFLGHVAGRAGVLNLAEDSLPAVSSLHQSAPLVLVAGTCMNSGKTQAAVELIKHLNRGGFRVAAGKLSGVAALRDPLNMQDHGALKTLTFLDCGLPSTAGLDDLAPTAKAIVAGLNVCEPQVIVLELGDGLLGLYEVESVFNDPELIGHCGAVVFCASDFVGAWGGLELLRHKGVRVDVVSGSVTDSQMGVEFVEKRLGVAAANSMRDGERLYRVVMNRLALGGSGAEMGAQG